MLVWEFCDGIPGPKKVCDSMPILASCAVFHCGEVAGKIEPTISVLQTVGPKEQYFPLSKVFLSENHVKTRVRICKIAKRNALKCMQLKTMERLLPTYCTQSNALKRALKTTLLDRQKNTQKNWT